MALSLRFIGALACLSGVSLYLDMRTTASEYRLGTLEIRILQFCHLRV